MHQERENGEAVTHMSTVEARSGSRSKVTRNILVASLALVILAFLAALGLGYLNTAKSGADEISADNTARNEVE